MSLNWSRSALFLGMLALLALNSHRGFGKPGVGGKFGLGMMAGDPNTGISMKYWNSSTTAIDGGLSWYSNWHDHGTSVGIHADYLIHDLTLIPVTSGTMPFYYGIGGFLNSYYFNYVGIRAPVGISYILPRHPLEFFLELSANLGVIPATYFWAGLAIGGRFYF